MELDRQAIERRDFPIARRGYDPAAVDAHLSLLARHIEELSQARSGALEPSLAATASSQVQSIIRAAETAAAEIERQALESARSEREDAERDARRTREQAIEQSRAHVAAVAESSAVLLERVGAMDTEVSALLESLRAGAHRLAGDLATADANMGELYDAAAGRAGEMREASRPAPDAGATAAAPPAKASGEAVLPAQPAPPRAVSEAPPAPAQAASEVSPAPARAASEAPPAPAPRQAPGPPAPGEATAAAPASATAGSGEAGAGSSVDLDGARLVALNMALNGESRDDTERYLAEHFQLAERRRLVDEVYAAIEA